MFSTESGINYTGLNDFASRQLRCLLRHSEFSTPSARPWCWNQAASCLVPGYALPARQHPRQVTTCWMYMILTVRAYFKRFTSSASARLYEAGALFRRATGRSHKWGLEWMSALASEFVLMSIFFHADALSNSPTRERWHIPCTIHRRYYNNRITLHCGRAGRLHSEYSLIRSSTPEYARVRWSMLEHASARSSRLEYARVRSSMLQYSRAPLTRLKLCSYQKT